MFQSSQKVLLDSTDPTDVILYVVTVIILPMNSNQWLKNAAHN